MAPDVTQADPQPPPVIPKPSATPGPGPKETDYVSLPTPASAHALKGPLSQQTTRLESESGDGGSGSRPVASSVVNGVIRQNENPNPHNNQIGANEDSKQKADPNLSHIENNDENSRKEQDPEQSLRGDKDAGSRQGVSSNSDPSKDAHDNPGQGGQKLDSSQTVDEQQSNDSLENDSDPWTPPKSTPYQQDNRVAVDSQKPGQAATINNQVVQPLRNAISIAGTTLSPGAPPVTVSGT